MRAANATKEGAIGGAMVTGYGGVGLLIESLVQHRWPWIQPGATTMAVVCVLHSAQSAWRGWIDSTHAGESPVPFKGD